MNTIKVKLIDMNKWSIDEEFEITKEQLAFKELAEVEVVLNRMADKGIVLKISDMMVSDKSKFERYVISRLFPGFQIEDTQFNSPVGHPDYIIKEKSGKTIYIEVKNNEDALRKNQIQWMMEKKDQVEIKLLLLDFKFSSWEDKYKRY